MGDAMTKKCELLSPAGNMQMLKYAVEYGADAVYMAGTKFGARKFATNFSDEEIVEAIQYAHLYGVKVYITINTLIYEEEIDSFVEYVKFIHNAGVDAVLVQDFGMLNFLRELMPNLELHASTQMHNNGKNMLEILKKCGVKRAVLDREMSIEEIKALPDGIEKEVFVHGALCVSYSGQCLFSSQVLNRSGNRGECAGMCRLPYRIEGERDAKYHLSLKDLCAADYLDKLLEIGVDSLKIEGRMKSPEYVGYITKVYRRLIDSYYVGHFEPMKEEEIKNIRILFNRGLTKGYLNGADDEEMCNLESPNHIGIHLGSYRVEKRKVKLLLEEDLHQGDAIRFKADAKGMTVNFLYNKNDKLINGACKGETVWVDNFLELEKSGELRLVGSALLNKELGEFKGRRVKITGKVELKIGKAMRFIASDGINEVCKTGAIVERAKSAPLRQGDVIKQVEKMGASIYSLEKLEVDLDEDCFVTVRDINALRREVLETLDEVRRRAKKEVVFAEREEKSIERKKATKSLKVVVESREQYDIAKKYTEEIYTTNKDLLKMIEDLKPKYEEVVDSKNDSYLIGDIGSLVEIKKDDFVSTDYMLNVTNSKTVEEFLLRGVSLIGLSLELDDSKLQSLLSTIPGAPLELFLYGRTELMKMKYDPLKDNSGKDLIDRNGKKYPVKRTASFNYLLSSQAIDRTHNIRNYIEWGITHFRVDFYDEEPKVCEDILKTIIKNLAKE